MPLGNNEKRTLRHYKCGVQVIFHCTLEHCIGYQFPKLFTHSQSNNVFSSFLFSTIIIYTKIKSISRLFRFVIYT